MAGIHLHSKTWSLTPVAARKGRARRGSAPSEPSLPAQFVAAGCTTEEFVAEPASAVRRRAADPGTLEFSYDLAEGEGAVLALRHPSGAITFHRPEETVRRGAGKAGQARFAIRLQPEDAQTGRRGVFSAAVKAILIKVGKVVLDKATSWALPKLAEAFEAHSWKTRELEEGWFTVTRAALEKGALSKGTPSSTERSLLLLHGTFSHAASAFGPLAQSDFFSRVAPLYGNRIFAFNHFSVSRTPEDNASLLLKKLPDQVFTFDVVTHSRGGLVLRNLVERTAALGKPAAKFKLGRAVLVASPNNGTPLATPGRWEDTLGWFANVMEIFPENPFTTGAEFIANALVWIARHGSEDLPGLHAMDSRGKPITELQDPPGPPPDAYSALVSNYKPDQLAQRLVDAGFDKFFQSANDLVVPSEGGWKVDHPLTPFVPASRIGCFGPGGNLTPGSVTHVDFFAHPQTVDFLVTALSGKPQNLPPVDPSKSLPIWRARRSAAGAASAASSALPAPSTGGIKAVPTGLPVSSTGTGDGRVKQLNGARIWGSDIFNLIVFEPPEIAVDPALPQKDKKLATQLAKILTTQPAQILATYGSARVLERFPLRGPEGGAGRRWHEIIGSNESIKNYINGQGPMPAEKYLGEFGKILFETLFPGPVRRLFDTARSLQRGEALNLILTSTIPWVADKPWELAYDPVRGTRLVTEELHFIRNVMTAIPAEVIAEDEQRLRILVAYAQASAGGVSVDAELNAIREAFEPLKRDGLVEIELLKAATPANLHGWVSTGRFSVVHFIGHAGFDEERDEGFLILQDDSGGEARLYEHSLREILCQRGIRLVFLNACETGTAGHTNVRSGLAQELVSAGVPMVVANQYQVLNDAAMFFAKIFYWSLAHGRPIGAAAREARIAVNYAPQAESIGFAVPVVYARDPNSRLCRESGYIDPTTLPSFVTRK